MTNPSAQTFQIARSRRYGCAIGAALGDAFGMPLEFYPARPLSRLVRTLTKGRLPAGTITDDTEMALALAESLASHRPLNPEDLSQRFLAWYRSNPPDIGLHTSSTLSGVSQGLSWEQAAAQTQANSPQSAGNGSLMRCWPVALVYSQPEQLQMLISESSLQSRVTHQHADCVAACVFHNVMLVELLRGADLPAAYEAALEKAPLTTAVQSAVRAAPSRTREDLPNSGWVLHTIEAALWAVLTTSSYQEAVIQAANLGNDADTTATVAGALAGAAYGLENIPSDWRKSLRAVWPPIDPINNAQGSSNIWIEADFLALVDRLE